jgi:hypothetical protein
MDEVSNTDWNGHKWREANPRRLQVGTGTPVPFFRFVPGEYAHRPWLSVYLATLVARTRQPQTVHSAQYPHASN